MAVSPLIAYLSTLASTGALAAIYHARVPGVDAATTWWGDPETGLPLLAGSVASAGALAGFSIVALGAWLVGSALGPRLASPMPYASPQAPYDHSGDAPPSSSGGGGGEDASPCTGAVLKALAPGVGLACASYCAQLPTPQCRVALGTTLWCVALEELVSSIVPPPTNAHLRHRVVPSDAGSAAGGNAGSGENAGGGVGELSPLTEVDENGITEVDEDAPIGEWQVPVPYGTLSVVLAAMAASSFLACVGVPPPSSGPAWLLNVGAPLVGVVCMRWAARMPAQARDWPECIAPRGWILAGLLGMCAVVWRSLASPAEPGGAPEWYMLVAASGAWLVAMHSIGACMAGGGTVDVAASAMAWSSVVEWQGGSRGEARQIGEARLWISLFIVACLLLLRTRNALLGRCCMVV